MIIRSHRLTEGNHVEEIDGKIVLTRTTNIDPLLEANYKARNDGTNGWRMDRSLRKIASIPMDLWLTWTKQYPELLIGDREIKEKTLRKLLKSEEASMFLAVSKGI